MNIKSFNRRKLRTATSDIKIAFSIYLTVRRSKSNLIGLNLPQIKY